MADDDGGEGVEAADVEEEKLSAEKAREAKQLDAVTDYHEDREIDTSKAQAVSNQRSGEAQHSRGASPSDRSGPSHCLHSLLCLLSAVSVSGHQRSVFRSGVVCVRGRRRSG